MNQTVEISKFAFATFCVITAALLPTGLLWGGVFCMRNHVDFGLICVGASVAMIPTVLISIYFSSNLAGFFVNLWGRKFIKPSK